MSEPDAIARIRHAVRATETDISIGVPDPRRWLATDTVKVLLAEYDRLVEARDGLAFGPRLKP